MFEILLIGAVCVFMYKVADAEDLSPIIWGVVTLLICIGCVVALPAWPFVRVLAAAVLAFFAMTGWNIYRSR